MAIESLTQEQRDSFPYYREKWVAIGKATGRADVEKAKPLINKIYTQKDLKAPKHFFHYENPIDMCNGRVIMKHLNSFEFGITKNAKNVVPDEEITRAFTITIEQFSAQFDLKAFCGKEWSDEIKAEMLQYIANQVAKTSLKEERTNFQNDVLYGNHEAHNLAYYEFWHDWFKFDFLEPMLPFYELAQHMGWWCAETDNVYTSDKPEKLVFDEEGRLHNTSGPALVLYGGKEIYCLEGYTLPKHAIMEPETLTLEDIKQAPDAETRRILREIYGDERYFTDNKVKVIDQDFTIVDANLQQAMPRMLVRTEEGDVYLIGTDGSTKRTYYMPIANLEQVERTMGKITTCKKAHELICGIKEANIISQS